MLSLAVVFGLLEFGVKFLDLFEDLLFVDGGQLMGCTLINHVITSIAEQLSLFLWLDHLCLLLLFHMECKFALAKVVGELRMVLEMVKAMGVLVRDLGIRYGWLFRILADFT